MIRYVLRFPGDLHPEFVAHLSERLKEAADAKEWRDIVLSNGGTITDMRRPHDPHQTWLRHRQFTGGQPR